MTKQLRSIDYLGIMQLCQEWRSYPAIPDGLDSITYQRLYQEVHKKVLAIVKEYDDFPVDLPSLYQSVLISYLLKLLAENRITFTTVGDFIKLQMNIDLANA